MAAGNLNKCRTEFSTFARWTLALALAAGGLAWAPNSTTPHGLRMTTIPHETLCRKHKSESDQTQAGPGRAVREVRMVRFGWGSGGVGEEDSRRRCGDGGSGSASAQIAGRAQENRQKPSRGVAVASRRKKMLGACSVGGRRKLSSAPTAPGC